MSSFPLSLYTRLSPSLGIVRRIAISTTLWPSHPSYPSNTSSTAPTLHPSNITHATRALSTDASDPRDNDNRALPTNLSQQILARAEQTLKNRTRWRRQDRSIGKDPSSASDLKSGSQDAIRSPTKHRPLRPTSGPLRSKDRGVQISRRTDLSPSAESTETSLETERTKTAYKTLRNEEWYSLRLQMLKDAQQPLEALKVLESMQVLDHVRPQPFHYSVVITSLAKKGHFNKCFSLFNDMKKRGMELHPHIYVSLLHACNTCETKQVLHGRNILNEYKSKHGSIDPPLLGAGMKLFIESDLPGEAKALFEENRSLESWKKTVAQHKKRSGLAMREYLTSPAFVKLYTIAMYTYAKCEEPHVVKELYEEYKSLKIKPDEQFYNTYLANHMHTLDEVKKITEEMKSFGIQPSIRTSMSLLVCRKQAKQYDYIGRALIKEIRDAGLTFDDRFYDAIVQEYARHSPKPNTTVVRNLLDAMSADRLRPLTSTLITALCVSLRCRNKQEAFRLFGRLQHTDITDNSHYLSVLKASINRRGEMIEGDLSKIGLWALLKLEEKGLWFDDMAIVIPGKGRWLHPQSRTQSSEEIIADLRASVQPQSVVPPFMDPSQQVSAKVLDDIPEMRWFSSVVSNSIKSPSPSNAQSGSQETKGADGL